MKKFRIIDVGMNKTMHAFKIEDFITPINGYFVKKSFFLITPDREFLIYNEKSVQCNQDRRIIESFIDTGFWNGYTCEELTLFLPPSIFGLYI